MKKGMLKPDDIMPEVGYFSLYTDAFRELSSCRSLGFSGVGPIPFTAIVDYTRVYEIEDFVDFIFIIREMDNEYLKLNYAKDGNNGTKNGNKSNRNKV